MGLITELPLLNKSKKGWPWTEEVTPSIYDSKKEWPKITIITPSYNQDQFLEETLRSVLLQNYPNLEYMVFDGGSTDSSKSIIEKYAPWLTFWSSEKDNGQSDAINKGFRKATGEIQNWLNSDDYYLPNALYNIAKGFENPQTLVVCGRSLIFDDSSKEIIKKSDGTDIYPNNVAKTIGWARIDQPETFFRKKAIDEIGILDEQFHFVMDKEWWIRFLLAFGINNINNIDNEIVMFRYHEASKTVSLSEKFKTETLSLYYILAKKSNLESEVKFIESLMLGLKEFNIKYDTLDGSLIKSVLHNFFLVLGCENYIKGNKKIAKRCLSYVDKSFLQKEDQKLLKTTKFRNKILPLFMIKSIKS